MIDPEPGEVPEDTEPMHLAVLEDRTDVGVAVDEPDVVFLVEADPDLDDDNDDKIDFTIADLLFNGRSLEEMQQTFAFLAMESDPRLKKVVAQLGMKIDRAVLTLRRELPEPYQFD